MKEEEKKKIANDSFWYTSSVYLAQFFGMFSGIATRKFLNPPEMGTWVLLQTFLNYGLLSELGILTSMYCLIPAHVGKGDKAGEEETMNAAFSFSLCASLLAACVFVALAILGKPYEGIIERVGITITGILVVVTLQYNAFISLLWAKKGFSLLGKGIVLNALLQMLIVFTAVRQFGLYGLYLGSIMVTLISLVFLYDGVKITPRFFLNGRVITALLRYGLPIFLTGMLYTFFISMDRVLIAKFMNTKALGIYSIALIVFSFSSVAPKMISIVLFPRIQEEYAASGSLGNITQMVIKPDLVIAFFSPLVLGMAYFAIPVFVQMILPKYVAGINAAHILLLGSFFLSLAYNVQSFLIAINKRVHSIPFLILAMMVGAVLCWMLLKQGFGIEGVALGMSAAFFVYFAVMTFYVLSHSLVIKEVLKYFGEVIAAFLYYVAWILWLGSKSFAVSPVLNCATQSFLLCLVSAPILYWADKRTSALRYGFQLLQTKLMRRPA